MPLAQSASGPEGEFIRQGSGLPGDGGVVSYSVDVNLLVFASNEGLTWPVLCGYQRIVTHPSIFRNPLDPGQAWANVRGLLAWPRVRVVGEEASFGEDFGQVVEKMSVRGNAVPDAHVATLLRQHGVNRIYSTDTDFRKFSFLEVINPLEK
ncbi:PIN domain-containing protein [bacterium]|nr:PIN domain-containing protein [bacterium]